MARFHSPDGLPAAVNYMCVQTEMLQLHNDDPLPYPVMVYDQYHLIGNEMRSGWLGFSDLHQLARLLDAWAERVDITSAAISRGTAS